MPEQMLMKDGLGGVAITKIAESIFSVDKDFDKKQFIYDAKKGLESLELKKRVEHIISILNKYLPSDFNATAKILKKIPDCWNDLNNEDIGSLSIERSKETMFAAWPIIDYVAEYGNDYPDLSLDLLEKLTSLFSAEFAIRNFIVRFPKISYKKMHVWCDHPNEHVRRLVSEGLRPRLPWGLQLKEFIADPSPIFPFLEKLKLDDSLYVRRSVANNLNDISKDHPESVIATCADWILSNTQYHKDKQQEVEWLVKHALRGLIKNGHPKVFPLLGYSKKPKLKISDLALKKARIRIGESLEFGFNIQSEASQQNFVLDYAVFFLKSNNQLSKKVFKLKNVQMHRNEILHFEKKHSFKKISTRNFYPGEHFLAIHINGIEYQKVSFTLQK